MTNFKIMRQVSTSTMARALFVALLCCGSAAADIPKQAVCEDDSDCPSGFSCLCEDGDTSPAPRVCAPFVTATSAWIMSLWAQTSVTASESICTCVEDDVDCVLSVEPVASACTQACGTLTNAIGVAQSGQGNDCPALTTYACQPGDGVCPAVCTFRFTQSELVDAISTCLSADSSGDCPNAPYCPMPDWDVSQVTSMGFMFNGAVAFNQPLADWDVSQVTSMGYMFLNAYAFNQPLADWDVSRVTDMGSMFYAANAFNQPLADWDVSRVTTMESMFNGAVAFNQPLADWDVSQVTSMQSMFAYAYAFNQDVGSWNWDISRVTSAPSMFFQSASSSCTINLDTNTITC